LSFGIERKNFKQEKAAFNATEEGKTEVNNENYGDVLSTFFCDMSNFLTIVLFTVELQANKGM
jgi:hypothetical protein